MKPNASDLIAATRVLTSPNIDSAGSPCAALEYSIGREDLVRGPVIVLRSLCVYAIFATLSFRVYAASPQTQFSFAKPFSDALNHECSTKHFEYLPAPDLNEAILAFRDALSPNLRVRPQQAVRSGLAECNKPFHGLACTSTTYIKGAEQLQLLSRLAKAACNLPLRCSAQFDCRFEP